MIKSIIDGITNPDKEYTPIPFWFLNDELSEDAIKRQLEDFKKKGVDGVVLHPRIGLPKSIPYLSDKFMRYIKFAVEVAKSLEMQIILYDEAMYPSGSAHGLVVKENPKYASQAIILTDRDDEGRVISRCKDGKFITQVNSGGTIRGVHFGEDDGEENAPPSADLLSQESVDTFIRLTHQRYFDVLKEHFGKTVIGFFTDEPSLLGRCARSNSFAWTFGFEDELVKAGCKLEDLEALFFGEENESTAIYKKTLLKRELEVYYGSLKRFCNEHGIALMGHPHYGDDIELEECFDVPGQDMVLRWIAPENDPLAGGESAQGKCSSDAARISGKRRNSNECFGVCVRDGIPWYFTGADMKWYIDYLGVRGVNMFIPHAFYYSVRGARRDERPPDVGPNNIWWHHYKKISDYMKRISYVMTDSENEARVAVMCNNRDMRIDRVRELYQNQIEFNYLPYSELRGDMINDTRLTVGKNVYEYVYCDDECRAHGVKKINGVTDLSYRDLYTSVTCPDLRVSRIKKSGVRMMFITNEGNSDINTAAAIDGEYSLIAFDMWSGKYWREPSRAAGGKTYFDLTLKERDSLVLILDENGDFPAPEKKEKHYIPIDFTLVNEDSEHFVKTYVGMATIDTLTEERYLKVNAEEMVECFVDGELVDVSLWNTHEFNLTNHLKLGKNTVMLKVTGNAANRFTERRIEYGLY